MTKVKFTEANAPELLALLKDYDSFIRLFMKPTDYGRCLSLWADWDAPQWESQVKKAVRATAYEVYQKENPPYEYENPLNGRRKVFVPPFEVHTSGYGYLKICPVCGSYFFCHRYTALYCSDGCAPVPDLVGEKRRQANQKYYQRTRAVKHPPRDCVVCGNGFTPRRKTKQTCSDECRKALSRQKGDRLTS